MQNRRFRWRDFLSFRLMITPFVVQVLFWLGLVVVVGGGVDFILSGFPQDQVLGWVMVIAGPVIWRLICELWLVIFRIYQNQMQRRDGKNARP